MRSWLIVAALMFVSPAAAYAAATPACPAKPAMPEPWLTWGSPAKAKAGHDVATATPIPLARAVEAALAPAAQVQYAAAPAKPPVENTYGGVFRVNIAHAARVGIALSGGAWVDMVEDGRIIDSVDHGHGPECTGIRKIVWFDLKPGAHIVQIANAPMPVIRIMGAELSGQR